MIYLDDRILIGKGSERSCFRHPNDAQKCIKVIHSLTRRTKARTEREIRYLKRYKRATKPLQIIPDYYGTIDTNLGKGHQFELIRDYDGSISTLLADHIKVGAVDKVIEDKMVQMYRAFLNSGAVASDLHPGNIALQRQNKNDFHLIMIDGFGNSDFIKICDYSVHFCKKKLVRKFSRLLVNMGLSAVEIE